MTDLIIGLALVVAGVLGLVLPRQWLLPAALLVLAIYPRKFYGENGVVEFVSPPLVLVLAWVVRSGLKRLAAHWGTATSGKALVQRVAFLLACWCVLLSLVSVAPITSLQWTAALLLCITGLCVMPLSPDEVDWLKGTWVVVGTLSALYGVLEFALQANPIYDPLYQAVGAAPVQHWSVYRPSAGFGHPLYAGLFLSMASALALGEALSNSRHRGGYAVAALLCAFGTALTASRSALGALAVAAGIMIVFSIFGVGRLSHLTKLLCSTASVAVVWSVYQLPSLQERLQSEEAQSSWESRFVLLGVARAAAEDRWYLGSGPGTSAISTEPHNLQGLLLESSFLQLFVSLGVLGLGLFLILIALSMLQAVHRAELGLLGLLVAFCITTLSFNALDSNRLYMLPLGLALGMSWARLPRGTHGTSVRAVPLQPSLHQRTQQAPTSHLGSST